MVRVSQSQAHRSPNPGISGRLQQNALHIVLGGFEVQSDLVCLRTAARDLLGTFRKIPLCGQPGNDNKPRKKAKSSV